jgi:DNA-binding CsgD family transcriptional regulator
VSTLHAASCGECGRVFKAATFARAEYANRRHSCDRTRELRERRQRVVERKTREGEKRDCQHKQARHEHGTRTAYVVDKCRCRPCTDAAAIAQRQREKQKLFGRYDSGRVDATPAREHVKRLMTEGIGLKRIARLAGVGVSTVGYIIYGRTERGEGPRKRIEKRVADAILAVKPGIENMACGAHMDATGTQRRIQALVSIGYSISFIGERIGIQRGNMSKLMDGTGLTPRTALKVRALYEELWDQPNAPTEHHAKVAATRARNMAKARKWAPPMAWDDDTIDDPAAKPEGVDLVERKNRRAEDLIEDAEDLLRAGCSIATITERLGMSATSIERAMLRAGRKDLARWIRTGQETREEAA